ncbi:hypothetical protein ACT80S_18590 [Ramlibacter sp. MAHUQ-53]|uniref:hypothetical protein n=1 Tax=unclassified Ramlibacter TaxID=2617605 RepID=UPI003627425D
MIDPQLTSFATVRELELLEALESHGTHRAAAKALGVSKSVFSGAMDRLKRRAASRGYSPDHDMTRTVPEGFRVKGVSTYYDQEGKPRGQWVKSAADDAARERAIREAYEAMAEDVPRIAPTLPVPVTEDHLLTLYTLTDCHVGALAWHREGGADWDLAIAEKSLIGCFEQMVRASPAATTGVVAQLGDFLHSDGLLPVTPTSGHVLDQDGRFSKVVSTAVRVLRRIIAMALEKHRRVVVLLAEGNHDMASSVWLRVMFRALYEHEPRVQVIDSELPYYVHQHGRTMLGFHHGHLKKNDGLPLLFAAQFPQVWGATTKRYAHTGHRHHIEEKEHSGMVVVQHPTLAARDAYAARGGWIAERQVRAITYHAEHGEVARNTVVPEMLA